MLVRRCEVCNKKFKIYPSDLKVGKGRNCSRECRRLHPDYSNNTKHGMSRTRLYQIWCDMKNRCSCPKTPTYEYYGARGIGVCKEWRKSFVSFRDWALANGYKDDLELDRKDSRGDYKPTNCRWATRVQQMRNQQKRRDAITSKYKGVSWCSNVGKWRVQIHFQGKPIHIGLFKNEVKAAKAYDSAAKRLFGEFCHLNF